MNLLITGANGFIGKAMLKQLQSEHRIYALVRDSDSCIKLDNVEFINHDLSSRLDTKVLPKKVDAVIHLAQSNQYRNFPDGMRDMADVNISGLVDVLEYARNASCQQFINFSSGSVYSGAPEAQSEESPIKPSGAYPLTKHIAEQITDLYAEFFTTLNIRLFFPYGPGQQNMLIPNIIDSVKTGKAIGLQGNQGGLVVCPIYVDDVVSICEIALQKNTKGLINVAGQKTISLKQIALEIGKVIDKEPVFSVDEEATPAEFDPSLTRMSQLITDDSFVNFTDGIRETINNKN